MVSDESPGRDATEFGNGPSERTAVAERLTDDELSALDRAIEVGYFEVPEGGTIVDVAQCLDRSADEVATQLRRGVGALLETRAWTTPTQEVVGAGPELIGAFEILRHPARVELLRALRRGDLPTSVEAVVDRAEAGEAGPEGSVRLDARELHQEHLPKLAATGFLQYDPDARAVTALDEDRIEAVVEAGLRVLSSLHAGREGLLAASDDESMDERRLTGLFEAGWDVLTSLEDDSPAPSGGEGVLKRGQHVDGVSTTQRALLRSALREGYFETPPTVTLDALAAARGLSVREASREFERGIAAVVRDVDLRP